ncbi:GcrA family cell cycle regulator [Aminobacter aminovorans]|uniref:GcrA cell cycle regulator n=1 Tax=Aminobacter aminovorans TaxID=83263 RepID=A0AAC8YMP5_AMIAI|nr:GcrA family cell cycle regulator [Aminobacter aminovorans]AMS41195.1 hypothetical protein AA2016_2267 [Aminobacter aminovorans]MBB3705822.1 hypothetical protein [Aminobacter aminovorans]
MTAWVDMNRRAKEAAVQPLLVKGLTYSEIAAQLGATSRNAVGTIASSLRAKGALSLKPRTSSPEPKAAREKRAGKTPAKFGGDTPRKPTPKRDKVLRRSAAGSVEVAPMRGPNNPHPYDFKARAEQRATSPGVVVATKDAFDPIPGIPPVHFAVNTGCKWPVDGIEGKGLLCCGADKEPERTYCGPHQRLSRTDYTKRQRAEIVSAERKFA